MTEAEAELFFSQKDDGLVFTSRQVMDGRLPVLLVSHEVDGSWQFLHGSETADVDNIILVHPEHVLDLDPSVMEVADLDPGWVATRAMRGESWTRRYEPGEE